jgi:hypothetical protein
MKACVGTNVNASDVGLRKYLETHCFELLLWTYHPNVVAPLRVAVDCFGAVKAQQDTHYRGKGGQE